jgi:hypothetical protein
MKGIKDFHEKEMKVLEDPSDHQLSSASCANIEEMKVYVDSFRTASFEQEDEETRYNFLHT